MLLGAGLALLAVELVALGILWIADPPLCRRVLAVVAAAFFGGRLPGILAGLELGLGSALTSLVNIAFNTCFILLLLPLFQKVTSSAGSSAWARRFFRGAEDRARRQHGRIGRFGTVGLAFFVWLPFPGTGAFFGALIGLMLGMPMTRLAPLLFLSLWAGVISWTYGIDWLFVFTGRTGHIVAWVVTGLLLLWAAISRFRTPPDVGEE
jgi:uncharacterized membrane protein